MLTHDILPDDLLMTGEPGVTNHPMDSSQMLLGLMSLSQQIQETDRQAGPDQSLFGVISKNTLRTLLTALRCRDQSSVHHSRRVASLAVGLSRNLGWDPPEQKVLEIACLLHDIGKVGIPDHILFKPGKLNPEEANMMALHHAIGIDVLQACGVDFRVIQFIAEASAFVPDRPQFTARSGDTHQGSRILAVADAYDSMSNDQVFRDAKPHSEILQVMLDEAGTRFDANVVAALCRWVETEGVPRQVTPEELSRNGSSNAAPSDPNDSIQANFLGQVFSHLYMLENLYDGFYVIDASQTFVVWNQGAGQTLGRSYKDILGKPWSTQLLEYSDELGNPLSDDECPVNRVISARKALTTNVRVKRDDGRAAEVEVQTVPLIDRHGQLQGVAEIFRDMRRGEKQTQYRDLKIAASRDALTAVANRGEMETQLKVMLNRFDNHVDGDPFSVIFIDVDFFKNINNTFGHSIGDDVLVQIAQLLQKETYSGDLVARYGGEEFVVICPSTDLDQAYRRAERLRMAIAETSIAEIPNYQISASFGVTEVDPGDTSDSVLQRADKALYEAKHTGRNRTVTLTPLDGDPQETRDAELKDQTPENPFEWTATFNACVASEMIIYKLAGFVTDEKAVLGTVTSEAAEIELGTKGLFSKWGTASDRQPVRIQIEFDHKRKSGSEAFSASRRSEVAVTITPIGRVRKVDVFQTRARAVVKLLRSYLVAD